MSSILKALEKAEEANSTKRLAGDSGVIRSRRSRPTWVMPVAVLCGAAVATLATFAAMGGFSRHAPAQPVPLVVAKAAPVVGAPLDPVNQAAAPAQAPPVEPAAATLPHLQAAAMANQKAVPVAKSKVGAAANLKTTPVADPKAAPLVNSKITALPVGKARVAGAVELRPVSGQPASDQAASPPIAPRPEVAPAVAPAPVRPELKVSGIAWQNNGESSFAFVNGRAVLQGGMVDGFKVLEIHQDTVRFSGANGNFDVPVGGDEK